MIKFNDRFTIKVDSYNWILEDSKILNPQMLKGAEKKRGRRTYHGTLAQALIEICHREHKSCTEVEQVVSKLRGQEERINQFVLDNFEGLKKMGRKRQ